MVWFIREFLTRPLYNVLIWLAWLLPGHSIGWAIIILTIIIRLLLLPASLKASKAQVKMQLLAPKMAEIKVRIKDQAEQGRALMELYKKEGVSPLGSCLPMLIQIPIIMVLYAVFRYGLKALNLTLIYNFIPHFGNPNTFFYGLDISKPEHWVLPILAGVSQFFLSWLTLSRQPKAKPTAGQAGDPMQMMNKQMVYLFPVMTIFIGRSLPAALVMYWIITTIFGIAQQLYVNKVTKVEKSDLDLVEEIEAEHEALPLVSPIEKENKPNTKQDMMTRIMNNKLEKQAKKSGVTVSIRSKK